jgi:histidine ammonia-lyase
VYLIRSETPGLEETGRIFVSGIPLALSEESKKSILDAHAYLLDRISNKNEVVYGVNTGFGALHTIRIPAEDLSTLQHKMVQSHACGMGEPVPAEVVRMMLLLKIISLAQGYSGVSCTTVLRLIDFYNHRILPVVFEQGSLGASGDLAPLAHLSLPLIGLGEVWQDGVRKPANEVLRELGWEALSLGPKEGLALLNGTQFMNAYLVLLCLRGENLLNWAEAISAISLDAFLCRSEPFHPALQEIRHHPGQTTVAEHLRFWLAGSNIQQQKKEHVQDPYSFRCIPQVLGAVREILSHVWLIAEREIAAVTDNPVIFQKEGEILSGGNFHGQSLAFALDYLCMALHETGSISERRVYQMVSGKRDLPPFLVARPGLNSGLMIVQYLAASLVSRNKQLCTPASVDSIESSAGQEDHVSMGGNAAVKAWQVAGNLETLLSIELFTATQALAFRRPLLSSSQLEDIVSAYRLQIPVVDEDRIFHYDIEKGIDFINHYSLPIP